MTDQIERLKNFDNDKLIDIVKNHRQYGYDDDIRMGAISILNDRGFDNELLKMTGNFENKTYDIARELYKSFRRNSVIAFILFLTFLLTSILAPALPNDIESIKLILKIIRLGSLILYFIFLIRSFINQNHFYKTIGKEYGAQGALIYFLIGMPLYIVMYFYFKSQMREQVRGIL